MHRVVKLACVVVIALTALKIILFFLLCLLCSRGVFQSLVTKHFPSEKQRREKAPGNKRKKGTQHKGSI